MVFKEVMDLTQMFFSIFLALAFPEVLNDIGHFVHEGMEVFSVIFAPVFFFVGPLDLRHGQGCLVKVVPAVDEVDCLDALVFLVVRVHGAPISFGPICWWSVLFAPHFGKERMHLVVLKQPITVPINLFQGAASFVVLSLLAVFNVIEKAIDMVL